MSWVAPRSRLAELSVRRPVTSGMLLLATLVVGVVAATRIPIEMLPGGATFPYLLVQVFSTAPEGSPREMEREVTVPIEGVLRTVAGVQTIHARSASRGAFLWIEFDDATDMDVAYLEVKGRLDRLRAQLPDDIRTLTVSRIATGDEPVLVLGATWPDDTGADPFYTIENDIARRLEHVDGVGRVEIDGLLAKSIRIQVNRNQVQALGVDLYRLVGSLRQSNVDVECGDLEDSGTTLFVRSLGRWDSLDAIRSHPLGDGLTLGDIAQVREAYSVQRTLSKLDGRLAVRLAVYKAGDANSVDVCRRLRAALADLAADPVLAGHDLITLYDSGAEIQTNIANLRNTLLVGGMLAVVVIFLFLRRVLVTLLVAAAIPVSLLLALVALYFSGGSINVLTLMGFTLATGMLVDNAIVVVESIVTCRQDGLPPRRAATEGAGLIALAIGLSTVTTLVVFLPSMALSDNAFMRLMLRNIGAPVCFALAGSLVVALLLVPGATVLVPVYLGSQRGGGAPGFAGLSAAYARLLRLTLRHRIDVLLAVVAVLVASAWVLRHLELTDRNSGGEDRITIYFELPSGYDLARAERFIDSQESRLRRNRTELGILHTQSIIRPGLSRIRLYLDHVLRGNEEREAFFDRIRELLPETGGVDMRLTWSSESQEAETQISVVLFGPDTDELERLGEEVERRLRRLPGLTSVAAETSTGPDELRVSLNRDSMASLGMDPRAILGSLAYALAGTELPPFTPEGHEIPVILEYAEDFTVGEQALRDIPVPSGRGEVLPLDRVLERVERAKGFGTIYRRDGASCLTVTATSSGGELEKMQGEVQAALRTLQLPRGYTCNEGGRFERWRQDFSTLFAALALSALLVFLLLAMLFESLALPFAVFCSVFLAVPGVFVMLWITRTPMDQVVIFGCIILVGVVVNNAIVLVDRINGLRAQGLSRTDAIQRAGRERFRPILMTAITTVAGILPMAYGESGTGIPYAPLGKTILGGIVASTALTLLVLPVLYTLVDDAAGWTRSLLFRLLGRPTRAVVPPRGGRL